MPAKALTHPEVKTAFDVFGSELPDEFFAGVFDQPRQCLLILVGTRAP